MAARSIAKIVTARQQAEGVGATVRRSIGVINQRKYNPFLMFDHFSSAGTNGFPEHPHRGQETITLILHGAIAHEDFTGSKGILYPGDLQFMTAGRGVVHSEMPVPNKDGSPTVGLQLWVDLPNHLKDVEPRYRDLRAWEIPEVVTDNDRVTIKVISGTSHGVESVKELAYTPVNYYYYRVKAGGSFKQELQEGFNYFLYVLNGKNLVLNNDTKIDQYQNVFFEEEGGYITGKNTATEDNEETEVQFVLVGGKKLDQDVVQYGPFVAATNEGIQKAIMDYQYARNGFDNVRTWRTLISNGVTDEMIQGPLNGSLEKREQMRKEFLALKAGGGVAKDEL
ncbi:PRN1 [[Candida] subhashii]|uniref:PRN1 n=1 Tax=[Candida] subhashii TaxID=561895 RepID=A0A8J5Q341_9ASCO|nr:PRN1 [[Candida] subhashii]KAG7661049.1 PRN1 [[Candida] subhashii]